MWSRYFLITITLLATSHLQLRAQQMTTKAPPSTDASPAAQTPGLPDDPAVSAYPDAHVVAPPPAPDKVGIESSGPQSYQAGVYTLERNVVVTYQDRRVQADHIEYDSNTGELTATGHLLVTGGSSDEHISASHGTYNLRSSTGRFYDVTGSVGLKTGSLSHRAVYSNEQPILFSGRMVVKTGPRNFDSMCPSSSSLM
jgi:LPS-assembly protein